MPDVVITQCDDSIRRIDAPIGTSIMRVALDAGIDGIEAVCGGVCACGTCHVYVSEQWLALLAPPDETEEFMLEEMNVERRPNSRLSCQIRMTAELSGIAVTIPAGE